MTVQIINADVLTGLSQIEAGSVRCVVTSPPYWGLRNYGMSGQLGLELRHDCLGWATRAPCGECYVCHMVDVFRGVRRVLAKDGTVWLNLGDSYKPVNRGGKAKRRQSYSGSCLQGTHWAADIDTSALSKQPGLKEKDLCMIPARVALALQADGWYLRQDNVWAKPNPMPESVRDRTTRAHEFVFMLAQSERYYYDHASIKTEPRTKPQNRFTKRAEHPKGDEGRGQHRRPEGGGEDKQRGHSRRHTGFDARWDQLTKAEQMALGANKRSVWWVPTKGYKGVHFATFPEALVEPCILAGSAPGDLVLDPFGGSGTTAAVALKHGRRAVLIELNPEYCELARQRVAA